jgi:hypothetical protein
MKDFSMVKTEEALAIIGGHVDEELLLRNDTEVDSFT